MTVISHDSCNPRKSTFPAFEWLLGEGRVGKSHDHQCLLLIKLQDLTHCLYTALGSCHGQVLKRNSSVPKSSFWLSHPAQHDVFCNLWILFKQNIHLKSLYLYCVSSSLDFTVKLPKTKTPGIYLLVNIFYNAQSLLVKGASVFSSVSKNHSLQMPIVGYRLTLIFQWMDIVWVAVTIYILVVKSAKSEDI